MPRKGQKPIRRMDRGVMKAALAARTLTSALGVVRKFPGETSHFEIDDENGTREILVDVELMPSRERVLCRLGFGNDGVYRIPRVDQEVAVLINNDPQSMVADPLDDHPIIVGVLDNEAPDELDDDDIVVVKATRVHIVSGDIKLGTSPNPLDGVVVGTGIDSFTGSPYHALGNTSAKVKAEK